MEINPAKLKDEIETFKKGIKKRNPDKFEILTQKSVKDKDSISAAVSLAYNDAKRTMSGIKEADRDNALKDIETALWKYFKEKPVQNLAHDFDKEHDNLCKIWCNSFENIDKEIGTYGKAQKIVNMSFKYLFCCKDADDYKEYFKFCHMPLDSYTLEWFKRDAEIKWPESKKGKKITISKIASWSTLEDNDSGFFTKSKDNKDTEYYSYHFYLKNIREHIDEKKYKKASGDALSPLELEFLIWPEIQRHLAVEGFIFGLEDNLPDEEKTDDKKKKDEEQKKIKNMPLDEKYRKVVKLLIEKGYSGDVVKLLADIVETLTEKGHKISISAETEEQAEIDE